MIRQTIAFTLAETLIVMGIIGVVSALTLPNLNASTGEKEKVAKVKKIYQNLEDALGRAKVVYGPIEEWYRLDSNIDDRSKRFGERITEFMKVSKTCGVSTGCFSTAPLKYAKGTTWVENDVQALISSKAYMYILNDGTSLAFDLTYSKIRIDIDGPTKGKNQNGVDRFTIKLCDGGLSLTGCLSGYDDILFSGNTVSGLASGSSSEEYSMRWVIMNDNMDYLKCANKLNWETKTSCK